MKSGDNKIPKFSVLMANFNKGNYISDAIESVKKQTYSNWELLIMDDASNDKSVEIIKRYLEEPKIRLYTKGRNAGKISVLRCLIGLSKGDILVELDSDDYMSPDTLEKIASAYLENTQCGMIYTQCYYCDENLKPVNLGFSALIPKGKSNLQKNCVHAIRTFKRESYLKTTGYDEECLYAEDIDLMLKLEEVTKVFFIDKPLYYYRILPKSQTHSFRNEMINRSSTALAKLKAYKRRQGADIPNLDKDEIAEVLFFGFFTALLSTRGRLAGRFFRELIKGHPFFLFRQNFYRLAFRKIKKIVGQKFKFFNARSNKTS